MVLLPNPPRTPTTPRAPTKLTVLLTLRLGVFVVNVSTTIVNTALPTLARNLDASTRDLLWIVDAFNLAFAALVLAAGSLSDRFGRCAGRKLLVGFNSRFQRCCRVNGAATCARYIPDSRDPSTPPLNVIGLVLSALTLGTLVYTIIEAPHRTADCGSVTERLFEQIGSTGTEVIPSEAPFRG